VLLAVLLGPTVTPESKSVENGKLTDAPLAVRHKAAKMRGEMRGLITTRVAKMPYIERLKEA
jgi:hypothetical protein